MAEQQNKETGYIHDTVDLRKWCVEWAIKWPEPGYASQEIDIISRAGKIKDWVVSANKKAAE